MVEVTKGQSNPPQLEILGNYRAVTAHDMDYVYSRNIAQLQLTAPNFAQNAFKKHKPRVSEK